MTMTLTAAPKAWISALLAKMVMVMVTSHGQKDGKNESIN